MYNLNYGIKNNSFVELLNKCENEDGTLIFKATGYKVVQYLPNDLVNKINIEKTSTTLIYNTKEKGNLDFHEYIYISLLFAIQNLENKISVNNITLELIDYVKELNTFIEDIEGSYSLDIEDICNRM